MPDEIHLNKEEEEALDRAWAKLDNEESEDKEDEDEDEEEESDDSTDDALSIFEMSQEEGKEGEKEDWLTIGGKEEGEEKHVGGFHVKIDKDGKVIAGGPKELRGQKVSDTGKILKEKNKKKPEGSGIREGESYTGYRKRQKEEESARLETHKKADEELKQQIAKEATEAIKADLIEAGEKRLAERVEMNPQTGRLNELRRLRPEQKEKLQEITAKHSELLGKKYLEQSKELRKQHGIPSFEERFQREQTGRETPERDTAERKALEQELTGLQEGTPEHTELSKERDKAHLEDIRQHGDDLNKWAAMVRLSALRSGRQPDGMASYEMNRAITNELKNKGHDQRTAEGLASAIVRDALADPGTDKEHSLEARAEKFMAENEVHAAKNLAYKELNNSRIWHKAEFNSELRYAKTKEQFNDIIKRIKEQEIKEKQEEEDRHRKAEEERQGLLKQASPEVDTITTESQGLRTELDNFKHYLPESAHQGLQNRLEELETDIKEYKLGKDSYGDSFDSEEKLSRLNSIRKDADDIKKKIGALDRSGTVQGMKKLQERANRDLKGKQGEFKIIGSDRRPKTERGEIFGNLAVTPDGRVSHVPTGLLLTRVPTEQSGRMLVQLLHERGYKFDFHDAASMPEKEKRDVPYLVNNFKRGNLPEPLANTAPESTEKTMSLFDDMD